MLIRLLTAKPSYTDTTDMNRLISFSNKHKIRIYNTL